MEKYSLILYGSGEDNLVTKILREKIPLKISSGEIEIGGRKFQAKDACVQMIYPHPLNPERYVLLVCGTSYAGMVFYNAGDSNYDFVIQDGSIPVNLLGRTEEKHIIATGVFDYNWQINDELLETGDPIKEDQPGP
jgi:hypothetical protein